MKTSGRVQSALRDLIVTARKKRRWTQKELSDRSGVNLATLRKFEQTGVISTDRLSRLVEYLGLESVFYQSIQSISSPDLPRIDDLLRGQK
jgi:transcriptional regulator with XRE-family HTH domain